MTADTSFADALHTLGFIEEISRFGERGAQRKDFSTEDYVGRITAIFSPYIPADISETKFIAIQSEVKKLVCEIRGKR